MAEMAVAFVFIFLAGVWLGYVCGPVIDALKRAGWF
jgi:hypothetical protein